MSGVKRSIYLKFLKHPSLVSGVILKSLRWRDGNVWENHQNTQVYVVPAQVFAEIRKELRATVGAKVASSILYTFNQASADSIVRDAEAMGFNPEQRLRYFLAVMALFGWGFAISNLDPETGEGELVLRDFPRDELAEEREPEPVHDDFRGILARALHLCYGTHHDVREVDCCESVDDPRTCRFVVSATTTPPRELERRACVEPLPEVDAGSIPKDPEFRNFRKRLKMAENGVLVLGPGAPEAEPAPETTEERVVIKDVLSINAMFAQAADLLGWATVGPVVFRVGRNYALNAVSGRSSVDEGDVDAYLRKFTLCGWGNFSAAPKEGSAPRQWVVTLENSAFCAGLPSTTGEPVDYLVRGLLAGLYEAATGTRVVVRETACAATATGGLGRAGEGEGGRRCEFSVRPLA
ncbi:MAG: hypothetical protein Kow0069_05690 [Promethearchaeota archaeon]